MELLNNNTNEHEKQVRLDIARQWNHVHSTVCAYVQSTIYGFHDAEDVIQQTALAFAEDYESFDKNRSVVGWALGIARHKVMDCYRCKKRQQNQFDEETLKLLSKGYQDIQAEIIPLRQALNQCIDELHARPRHVLELYYLREMTARAIADRLGTTTNAICVMLHRIRTALAQCIQRKTHQDWEIA